uniref:Uncharacterized protein n=1 Tax=Setaria italica TaxID=4555 RepID=K4AH54_SETIT
MICLRMACESFQVFLVSILSKSQNEKLVQYFEKSKMDPHHQQTKELSITQDDLNDMLILICNLVIRSLWCMTSREGSRNLPPKDTNNFTTLVSSHGC